VGADGVDAVICRTLRPVGHCGKVVRVEYDSLHGGLVSLGAAGQYHRHTKEEQKCLFHGLQFYMVFFTILSAHELCATVQSYHFLTYCPSFSRFSAHFYPKSHIFAAYSHKNH
jgi:hypothetical protein